MAIHPGQIIAAGLVPAVLMCVGVVWTNPHILAARTRGQQISLAELLALSATNGIALATLVGLVLGYLGVFSLTAFIVCLMGVLLLGVAICRPRLGKLCRGTVTRSDFLAAALSIALVLYAIAFRSHEIQGFRDPGVYTCSGIQLARTGSFFWTDRLIAQFGFDATSHLFEDIGDFLQGRPRFLRFPGFYLCPPSTGRVVPQFLHGYEVWMATAYAVGGPQATQCLNGLFAALGTFLVYLVARRLTDNLTGLVAAMLLALSLPELWFSRFPSNEPLLQVLLWSAVLAFLQRRSDCQDRSDRMVPCEPDRALSYGPLFLPLFVATTVKFAFWPLLGVFAAELGFSIRERSLVCRPGRILLILMGIAGAAYLHARLFAEFYLYGSWSFTLKRFGISYDMFPVLFVGGVGAAFLVSLILAEYRELMGQWWRRWRLSLATLLVATIGVILAYQALVLARTVGADPWSERTTLREFGQYYGLFVVPIVLLGYWFWTSGKVMIPHSRLVALLVLASAFFLVKRNLDAWHPWASRRWVPVLFPATSFALAIAVTQIARMLKRCSTLLIILLTCLVAAAQIKQAPILATVANHRGAIPQVDQWASILKADDFVLFEPSEIVAQYGAYLAARFDIQGYVQRNSPADWTKTKSLGADLSFRKKRTIYVTDEDLSSTGSECLTFLGAKTLEYPVVTEALRRLPDTVTTRQRRINFYQIDWTRMPPGWWTQWRPPVATRPPQQPPIRLVLDAQAEPYLLRGFFDVTEQPNGLPFRWTDGNAHIAVGKLLAFPLSKKTVRFVVVAHSGRDVPIDLHWYLNFDDPHRAKKLAVTTIKPEWTESAIEIPAETLEPDTVLCLQTLRPAVAPNIPSGRLGLRIQEIRIE